MTTRAAQQRAQHQRLRQIGDEQPRRHAIEAEARFQLETCAIARTAD